MQQSHPDNISTQKRFDKKTISCHMVILIESRQLNDTVNRFFRCILRGSKAPTTRSKRTNWAATKWLIDYICKILVPWHTLHYWIIFINEWLINYIRFQPIFMSCDAPVTSQKLIAAATIALFTWLNIGRGILWNFLVILKKIEILFVYIIWTIAYSLKNIFTKSAVGKLQDKFYKSYESFH